MQIVVSWDCAFQRFTPKFLAYIVCRLRIQLILRGNRSSFLRTPKSVPEFCWVFLSPCSGLPPSFSLSFTTFSVFLPHLELENVLRLTATSDGQLSSLIFLLLWNLGPSNSHRFSSFLLLLNSSSSQTSSYGKHKGPRSPAAGPWNPSLPLYWAHTFHELLSAGDWRCHRY